MPDQLNTPVAENASRTDGGPAFPSHARCVNADGSLSHTYELHAEGISLRDYFAGQAPKRPQPWFAPDFPPKPEPAYDHDHPNLPSCQYADCSATNWNERMNWNAAHSRALLLQWPYAWADAMLVERAKAEGTR